jgi:hypothetical protein
MVKEVSEPPVDNPDGLGEIFRAWRAFWKFMFWKIPDYGDRLFLLGEVLPEISYKVGVMLDGFKNGA